MNQARVNDLLEANEQLVLAVVRAQEEADRVAHTLRTVDHTLRLEAVVGAPDGTLMYGRLAHGLAVAKRSGTRLGLLFVSLENVQDINDTLGHAMGEQVLNFAAWRLGDVVRGSDQVSRLGDHQFLVQLMALSQPSDAQSVADSALASLALPIHLGGREVRLRANIGISVYPDDGDDADALVDRATAAMYHARREGVGSYLFQGELGTNARSLELRQAEARQRDIQAPPVLVSGTPDLTVEVNQHLVVTSLQAQELLAAAEVAQRAHTALMGVVAHELRGPLAPLSNAAAMLAHPKASSAIMPVVKGIIDRQVSQLGRLVGDLLDVTRFSTGRLRLEVQRLNLREVLTDCCEAVLPAIAARSQQLVAPLDEGDIPVNGDRMRLTQVFRNLLDNAAKYTPKGGTIHMQVWPEGDRVVVMVSDNGIGISSQSLPHVFDRYVQEGRAMCFNPTGLGIGLALVRDLVTAHDGTVTAESAGPLQGSRFTVSLPLLPIREQSAILKPAPTRH